MKLRVKAIVKVLVLLIVTVCLATGCSDKEELEETGKAGDIDEQIEEPVEKQQDQEEKGPDLSGARSKLTGLSVDEEVVNPRVIAVMLDNQKDGRPQACLSKSDVVYEILAEGNITRYMAIIESEKPDDIGPVRSARDYFIDRALEYDSLYVHVGGSPQGLAALVEHHVASVNSMNQSSKILWRKNHKSKPHNMYASYDSIIQGAKNMSYRSEGSYEGLRFLDKGEQIGEQVATYLEFPYRGKKYYSSYDFNEEDKVYYRSVNGEAHKDEVQEEALYASNIIVQFVKTWAIPHDPEGRLGMAMVGQGEGYYISRGNVIPVTWKKKDEKDMTRYYDDQGKEIDLNPGNIWIQVYPEHRKSEVIIK